MKTTKYLTLVLYWILFISSIIQAQEMTQENKAKYIGYLYTNDDDKISASLLMLTEANVVEAIPDMVVNIWNYNSFRQFVCLYDLYKMKYSGTHELTLAYYDSLSSGKSYSIFSNLELRCMANQVLFELGDFSKRQSVFDYVGSIIPELDKSDIYLLEQIIKNVPSDAIIARGFLINSALNGKNPQRRWIAMSVLEAHFGSQIVPEAIHFIEKDSDWVNRSTCVSEILAKYKSEEIRNAFLKQINSEKNDQILSEISEGLLKKYGSPIDLNAVKKVFPSITDTVFSGYVKELLSDEFIGPQIYSMSTKMENIDSLISYQSQCSKLSWLGNSTYSTQLQQYLTSAKTKLMIGDSLGTALKIKQYQSAITQAFQDPVTNTSQFVTSDGYKFLYYYPKYILERLPKLPTVKLNDSQGKLINSGSLQYYEGTWKDAVNNNDGTFTIPTTLKTISLRMNYAYGSQTKNNVSISADTVVFQTTNVQVKLQNSLGDVIDTGKVQYYAGAWRDLGVTSNGIAVKELLPGSYSFRMNYSFASSDKVQDVSVNNVVLFQTVPVNVQLKNSSGNFIDVGTVQYYSGAWRDLGATTNGVAIKELLPNSYSFRMNYAFASLDKSQNVGTDPTVVFQTVPATVQLKNSSGNFIDGGTVQYYSGAWRDFGITTNGVVIKELLPNSYSFRMSYSFASSDKVQDVGANNIVLFQTVPATVQLKKSSGNFIDVGTVQYYSGAWRDFGSTVNGISVKELLPNSYSFRMTHEFISLDRTQNIGTNNIILFNTVLARISVTDNLNQLVNNAMVSYYSGAWRQVGNTTNGVITKELLPVSLSFRAALGTKQVDKTQNIGINNNIDIKLP